jgi:hypothetical protein
MSKEEYELKVDKVNTIYEECKVWNSAIQVTNWINGEGYDIVICHGGSFQHLSVTWSEFDIIKKAIKKIDHIVQ